MSESAKNAGVGVDGCRGGWLAAWLFADGWGSVRLFATFAEAMDAAMQAPRVFVDVPVGLPHGGSPRREADALARAFLSRAAPGRGRSSSIFNPPARCALHAETHAQASALNRAETGMGLSCQSFNILPAIREADHWLRNHPQQTARVLEAHPEVAFAALGPSAPQYPKKRPEGYAQRLKMLEDRCTGASALAAQTQDTYLRRQCGPDDVLDAMVLALGALHHEARPGRFPGLDRALPVDGAGLPMAIHYARLWPEHAATTVDGPGSFAKTVGNDAAQ